MKRLLKDKRGEGFVDVCVLVLAIAMVLALVVRIAPVFVAKQNLDVFADELVRTAEINGQVGSATNAKAVDLREQTGLDPNISWSDTGKIQLGNEVEVTLTTTVNIGLFGEFASFPVTLTAGLRRCIGSEEDSRSPEKQIRARRTDDFGRCPLLPDSGLCDL